MRAVVQRVSRASVFSDGSLSGSIGKGLLVFLGIARGDGPEDIDYIAMKIFGLRIFSDADGKLNLDVRESGGSILLISQFTLLGDARKGRRPSYGEAAPPDEAVAAYDACRRRLHELGLEVEGGVFRTHMDIDCVQDGPVTILLDSHKSF